MGIIDYNLMRYFSICNEMIDKHKDDGEDLWGNDCNATFNNSSSVYSINRKICQQALLYLADIHNINDMYLGEYGCKYLYYWISPNLNKWKNDIDDIKSVYIKLLNLYGNKFLKGLNHKCYKYKDDITEDDLQVLKAMYDIRTYASNNKKIGYDNVYNGNDFSVAVNIIKNHYELPVKTEIREVVKDQLIPCNKTNIGVPIIITVIVMLITSIFLFMLYKYTTLGSYLRLRVKNIKRNMNNDNEEWNKRQSTEISRNILSDSRYNIFYNFD
ncbi:variable surface protein [Plasmodium gonderi]|uniref:Variable surface protein n=1 Tax=Plasmodium gonderi TaxID=77519 RepID=A0A1Y1JUS9_PLAGO|nr:variable surface protein [Plasmodium gonderi]GAW84502.1 variable surface protein [Plasmodium gonderi]